FDAKAVSEEVVNIINELRRINGITLTPRYGKTQDDIALNVTDEMLELAKARAQELITNFSHNSTINTGLAMESIQRMGNNETTLIAKSNEELAYNIVLNWFSEYNNMRVSFGHRIHLLGYATG
ncbi:hypothetical protein, partial [Streptococcus suis]